MQSKHNSSPLYEVRVERQVPIPMADGTISRADVYRPNASGRYPVLVEHVAYELEERCRYTGEYHASRGYVVVGQNVRGRFISDGEFAPFRDDGWSGHRDGYDTILWAGKQPWSNGAVGMLDGSYSGGTQYLLAPTRPPFLKALFAREGLSDIYRDFVFRGGAYQLRLHREWAIENELAAVQALPASPEHERMQIRLQHALADMDSWYRHLPLQSCPPLEGLVPWYFEDLRHPEDGPYWWSMNLWRMFHEVDTPILHFGGWFDEFLNSTLGCFQGIREHGKTETCRANQRLIIGPWVHGSDQMRRSVGELDFGAEADFDLFAYRLQWYDYWLKEIENGVMEGPPVRIFLMGANRWLDAQTWPLPDTTYQPVYLRQGTGRTDASLNNGSLTFELPPEDEPAESFLYDPAHPVESLLSRPLLSPKDHRSVEGRMFTYTTRPLEHDLTVVGPVKAILYAMSSAPDTDWIVRLCDVWPDGRSMSVCDGILRARYRDSFTQPALMHPGQVYRFEIDLQATAQVFQAGHQLRVEVTSSDFPRYDRNLNTGGVFGTENQWQVANNTLFYDRMRASHILLPIRPS